jgi:hypothetical protein
MSKVVLDMSMSVDGFITGPDDGMEHGLGVNGERLHDWLRRRRGAAFVPAHRRTRRNRVRRAHGHGSGDRRSAYDRVRGRLGRRSPRRGPDLRADPYRIRRPRAGACALRHRRHRILRRAGQGRSRWPRHPAARRRDRAGVPSCRPAGRDELHQMPVLLGQGRRLFEDMPPDHIELELLRALDGPGVLHLRYRVQSAG